MQKNMGTVDRIIRAVIGVAAVVLGIVYQSWLGALGAIPLLTALIARCPLYYPFKIRTICKASHSKKID